MMAYLLRPLRSGFGSRPFSTGPIIERDPEEIYWRRVLARLAEHVVNFALGDGFDVREHLVAPSALRLAFMLIQQRGSMKLASGRSPMVWCR
jgi:hypothetical protein